jgi:undecaprenyl-diphosphatase
VEVSTKGRAREALILIAAVPVIGFAVTMGLGGALDEALLRALALNRETSPDWLISGMQWLSWVGDDGRRAFFLLIFGGMLAFQRRPRAALVMIAAPVLANITSSLMKSGFDRARPNLFPHLDDFSSASFPSGHATSGAAIFLLAALLIPYGSVRLRMILALVVMFLIGISRPMLGVHWPSDVVSGWMLGAGFALLAAELVRRMEMR